MALGVPASSSHGEEGMEEGVVLLYWLKAVLLYWVEAVLLHCGEWWRACTLYSPTAHTDNTAPVPHTAPR